MSSVIQTDITIIGAGPAGLFAVFQAGMLGLKCHVIDTLDAVGGQCAALYPEKPIYDIPGFPSVDGGQLVELLAKQAEPFKAAYHLGQQVVRLESGEGRFLVTTSKGTLIESGAVIIAAGCGAFGPNRPALANIEQFEGSHVFYMVNRKEDFRDKNIVIAGGGDSAVDWANALAGIAKRIYVIHRRNKFRAMQSSVSQMECLAAEGKIELVIPYQLDALEGENGKLDAVVVSTLEGEKKRLEADALLSFFGLSMELGPILDWGLNLDKNHITVNPATMETSTPGIYAIGDIASYPGKLKLILTGFAESAIAAHEARLRLKPDQALHFEYSTTRGVPGNK